MVGRGEPCGKIIAYFDYLEQYSDILTYVRGPKNVEALVLHPLSCKGIFNRETCHFPTWRVPLLGKFGRSEQNSMDVGRGPWAKIMGKLGPCRFEMEKWQTP